LASSLWQIQCSKKSAYWPSGGDILTAKGKFLDTAVLLKSVLVSPLKQIEIGAVPEKQVEVWCLARALEWAPVFNLP